MPEKELPLPGEVFTLQEHIAFLILPEQRITADLQSWVWYAPTLPGYPADEETWMFRQFLDAGMPIAGIDVGESYGSPRGTALYTALYTELTQTRGLSQKACFLARSPRGLMLNNWAVEHPASVACIAGIYPVCNLKSYPGIAVACSAYGMTGPELSDALPRHNPVERVASLVQAGVPIFHIHGDADTVVPLEENSAELARQYRRFGGEMTLNVIKGQGHDMWPGWFRRQELVDFVIAHSRRGSEEYYG